MYYATKQLPSGKEELTRITADNVIAFCPLCDEEVGVNLIEVIRRDARFDFMNTGCVCGKCAERLRAESDRERHEPTFAEKRRGCVTLEGLRMTTDILARQHYGTALDNLFDDFQIDDVSDLDPVQYVTFYNALAFIAENGTWVGFNEEGTV